MKTVPMTADEAERVMKLIGCIRPFLAGQGSAVQSAVLADLLSMWLAGHTALSGETSETDALRAQLLAAHIELVSDLLPDNDAIIRTRKALS